MLTQVQKSKNNTHRKDFERNYKELVLQKSMKGKQIPSHAFLTINFVGVMLVFFLTGTQFGPQNCTLTVHLNLITRYFIFRWQSSFRSVFFVWSLFKTLINVSSKGLYLLTTVHTCCFSFVVILLYMTRGIIVLHHL